MPKFRKRPVVIEAVQYAESGDKPLAAVMEFTKELGEKRRVVMRNDEPVSLLIQTLEGWMTASPGDWIIRGVAGEYYPCKPDIFAKTYEAVPDVVP